MSKHTPGPWYVPKSTSSTSSVWAGGGDIMVADCKSASLGLAGNRSNAQLISAAPDLLEALELLIKSSSSSRACQDGLVDQCICQDCANKKSRAAIAKAKGETL